MSPLCKFGVHSHPVKTIFNSLSKAIGARPLAEVVIQQDKCLKPLCVCLMSYGSFAVGVAKKPKPSRAVFGDLLKSLLDPPRNFAGLGQQALRS